MRQYRTLREAEGYLDSTLAFARLGVPFWVGFDHWMQRARMLRCVSTKLAKIGPSISLRIGVGMSAAASIAAVRFQSVIGFDSTGDRLITETEGT